MELQEILIRLSVATLAGIILGLDREMRGIAAGVRTHALVALSSGLITVSAFMVHADLLAAGDTSVDPLRVVQGLAQAVGFVAAGTIFFARGTVHNLTSAANVWLAAAVGIAAGIGQYSLVVAGMAFGVIIVTVVRGMERWVPGNRKATAVDTGQAAQEGSKDERRHVKRAADARKRPRRLLRQRERRPAKQTDHR